VNGVDEPAGVIIAQGRFFSFEERGSLIRATFTDAPYDGEREDLATYGFGWADRLGAWVLLGGPHGREVAKSLTRRWLAEEAREPGEPPDYSADIIASAAEDVAINWALDIARMVFYTDDGARAVVSDLLAANAEDADVVAFVREQLVSLAVGASATFEGGASGSTEFRRIE